MSSVGAASSRSGVYLANDRSWSWRALVLFAMASSIYACSADDSEGGGVSDAGRGGSSVGGNAIVVGGTSSSGGNGSGNRNGDTGSGGNSGSTSVVSGGSTSCTIENDGSGCIGESYEGEGVPLDIYIMFDQSGSMCSCVDPEGGQRCPDPDCNATRMDAVREAVDLFLADPASVGIGLGIGYFGKQPIGEANCDAGVYADAAVEIGQLPDNAPAIMDSLAGIEPTGETPTGAAIRGACDYVTRWKEDHPGRQTVILLLTDGKPEAPVTCSGDTGPCCPTLLDAVDAARECFDSKALIKTYVLGVGPLLRNLEEIAIAGGTERAYLVEGGNVAAEVLDALNSIRGAALPCQFELPEPPAGQELAYDQVNITYANAVCEPSHYYYVETPDRCGDEGGWYYDDAEAPERIELCPSSCDQVSTPGGRLLFTVGCETRVPIR